MNYLFSSPQFSCIGLSRSELLPGFMSLFNDLLGLGNIQELFVKSERVDGLVIGGLVPAEMHSSATASANNVKKLGHQFQKNIHFTKISVKLTGTTLGYPP
jgi:hypothetical protein